MAQTTSPEIESLTTEITSDLRALPDFTVKPLRNLRRSYTKRLAGQTPRFVVNLALELISRSDTLAAKPAKTSRTDRVYRFLAYEFVHFHRPALHSLKAATLERLGQGMSEWFDVDTFGVYLSGPAWCNNQIKDAQIHRWTRSKDRWWRRAALVSTVPLNLKSRGGCGDCTRTLGVCELLIDDRDDMVVKALSWALRELVSHNPKAVRGFIAKYEDRLAARVLREVRNKLTTGVKNPRR
jgi:3-methyladenine DNA glycosylase AlkD